MFGAELRWAMRGRAFITLLFLAIALNALSVYGTVVGLPDDPMSSDLLMRSTTVTLVGLGFGGSLFSLVFGALVATSDFGNSSIIRRSFLAGGADSLLRLRLATLAIPTAIFAVVSAASVIATATIVLPMHGYTFETSHTMVVVLLGVLFTVFVMGYIGHLAGWLIRNTVVALIGLVAYTLVAEPLIISLIPKVGIYLPGGAMQSITIDKSATELILPVGAGYAVLVGWVAVLVVANLVRLRKNDLV
jgi:hypothetical protein